jgi:hypothetical protein
VNARIALIVLVAGLVTTGCRPRGIESFVSSTTPQANTGKYQGDKYSNGGIASASGGRMVSTNKDLGAKKGAGAQMNTSYDAPAKGSGQQPGENPGAGTGNGPAMQGSSQSVIGRVRN